MPRPDIAKITPTGEFDLLLYDYNWSDLGALELFLSSEKVGTTNRVAYSNPAVDAMLAEISKLAADPSKNDEREQKIIEVQELILADAPWQPLLARRVISAINVRVTGEKVFEGGSILWQDASIK